MVISSEILIMKVLILLLASFCSKANEPKISSRKNNYGNVYFRVYDPQTKRNSNFSSEQEVRMWLDNRYYK